ncbi:hypothetical protein [Sphingomonas sp.]|uniref:hypothetical protein n=1 Tax=Sphingomonas sp. TaxID=28214 RepID=UPI00258C434F|nr:hypothetical protein [Sphingomonas sp.]
MVRSSFVFAAMLAAALGAPAQAQDQPPAKDAGHAARDRDRDRDIIVTGTRSRLSSWKQADTDHVSLIGDGSEAELSRIARNVERLHWLLSGLFGRSDQADDVVKIRITLIGDTAEFSAMDLQNTRWQQGPFNDLFQVTRYYDPREDGAVMATTRVDQRTVIERTPINLRSIQSAVSSLAMTAAPPTTGAPDAGGANAMGALAQQSALIGDFAAAGLRGPHDLTVTVNAKSIDVPATSMIYAGYAQHFLMTYFPAAYPRWYLDGFGQIFASFALQGQNQLIFGRSPAGAGAVFDEFGGYPLGKVLDDSYLAEQPRKTGWTPIHAWLLTHYLLFSDTRRPQLNRYLAMRANGAGAAEAAKVFGDQKQLAAEIRKYMFARKPYEQVVYTPAKDDAPLVRRLTEGEAAFVKGRLELGSRIAIPDAPQPNTPPGVAQAIEKQRARALAGRDRWLARLRTTATRWPNEVGAHLLLAEAECKSDHAPECLASAERARALAPEAAAPMAWQGMALVLEVAQAPADERPALIARARSAIAAANRIDGEAIEPLLAYHASFAQIGATPPTRALDALQKVMTEVPNAPAPRLKLASGLVGVGNMAAARTVILPVAAGAYDSPERPAARALLQATAAPAIGHSSPGADTTGNGDAPNRPAAP